MKEKVEKKEKQKKRLWQSKAVKIILIIFLLLIIAGVVFAGIKLAPGYKDTSIKDRTNLVINNSNVTERLQKNGTYVYRDEKGVWYLSFEDVENFFDSHLYFDEKYQQVITTSGTQIASIEVGKNEMYVNSAKTEINGTVMEKDGKWYLPFSEMENVYNVEVTYIEGNDTIVIESLDKKLTRALINRNTSVKARDRSLCRTIEKLKKGDSVIIVAQFDDWTKIRTANGNIGFVKTKVLNNITEVRSDIVLPKQIEGQVNLVWDYYSEVASAPDRTGETIEGINVVSPSFFTLVRSGQGEIDTNIGEEGKAYIEWAHQNGYKIWPMLSNNSLRETTEEIMQDYKLRENLINNIVNVLVEYQLDGVNIDFENMNAEDKDLFSRFIIELEPRLKELGMVLSVDVTAPDGGENWSLCYDRNVLADVADYLIFMAYDQHGASSTEAGTVAGYDWVEVNIKKFLGQEGVAKEKLILAMPLYTRLWKEVAGEVTPTVVFMNEVEDYIPEGVEKVWNEDTKQYYIEYTEGDATYKMWIEDEESIKEKLGLIEKYELAGSAFWEKDRETPGVWTTLKEMSK